eukprot:c39084_g1_i1.p1 GENE.c39084_g1_i1~~c39084_g1_i1.p1  ORF type:complete len:398 (-),score=78.70 c39084_g1_i1:46-1203(-)
MSARPLVQVFATNKGGEVVANIRLPGVFSAPIRSDIVSTVSRDMAKNSRQAYAVSELAGHQATAESWGTGRAVARVPRVTGGGTHRAGQGAYANMCRGGRMFAPTKTWRRWHRKISVNQRRYATTSALAASAITPLVLARGHRVSGLGEIPLVLSNEVQSIKKTREAVKVLKEHGAFADIERVQNTRKMRAGAGKMRGRRFRQRRGPLVVYLKDDGLTRAFRNIPGVELCSVERLNLLQLAPGGHLGRFILWTQAAFERLDALYGSTTKRSTVKAGYKIPYPMLTNTDVTRIINSDEIQSAVRAPKGKSAKYSQKKNGLKNLGVMLKLNPYVKQERRANLLKEEASIKRKEAKTAARKRTPEEKKVFKARKAASAAFFKSFQNNA